MVARWAWHLNTRLKTKWQTRLKAAASSKLISCPLGRFLNSTTKKKKTRERETAKYFLNKSCRNFSYSTLGNHTHRHTYEKKNKQLFTGLEGGNNSSPAWLRALSWCGNCDWVDGRTVFQTKKHMKEVISLIESPCGTEKTILTNTDVRLF